LNGIAQPRGENLLLKELVTLAANHGRLKVWILRNRRKLGHRQTLGIDPQDGAADAGIFGLRPLRGFSETLSRGKLLFFADRCTPGTFAEDLAIGRLEFYGRFPANAAEFSGKS
jgi:hypothetical protein